MLATVLSFHGRLTPLVLILVPGPASKDKNDLSSSPNDALLQPDGDKVFYENLPFHGMQNPPNKVSTAGIVFNDSFDSWDVFFYFPSKFWLVAKYLLN